MTTRPAARTLAAAPLSRDHARLGARLALGLLAAHRAATAWDVASLGVLKRALVHMQAASPDGLADAYAAFHLSVARAARNPVLEACLSVLMPGAVQAIAEDAPSPELVRRWLDQHDELVRCVTGRDARGSVLAMAAHLDPQERYRAFVRDLL